MDSATSGTGRTEQIRAGALCLLLCVRGIEGIGQMKCFFCLRDSLSPSRIHWYDWPLSILLLRPYRCCDCGRRTIGFVWYAFWKSTRQDPIWFPEMIANSVQRPIAPAAPTSLAADAILRPTLEDGKTNLETDPLTPPAQVCRIVPSPSSG